MIIIECGLLPPLERAWTFSVMKIVVAWGGNGFFATRSTFVRYKGIRYYGIEAVHIHEGSIAR